MLAAQSRYQAWKTVQNHWPNHAASQFVEAGDLRWHVQIMGDDSAPPLLLLHGTGASAHSFRDLMPALAARYLVIAPDLPGHGFTATPAANGLSLPGMARLVMDLIGVLAKSPVIAMGHSAGAAILIYMAGRYGFSPRRILSINGALEPIHGHAIFAPLARLLFVNPLVPRLFALRARFGDVTNFVLSKTDSDIDSRGIRCYGTLLQSSEHVEGALGMMANWDLSALQRIYKNLDVPITLVAAEDDRTVPASVSRRAAALIPDAELVLIQRGGHLLHEVHWQDMARLVEEAE